MIIISPKLQLTVFCQSDLKGLFCPPGTELFLFYLRLFEGHEECGWGTTFYECFLDLFGDIEFGHFGTFDLFHGNSGLLIPLDRNIDQWALIKRLRFR